MSFLAIDVGNTRLKWALYAHPQPGAALLSQGASFLENIDALAESEWSHLAEPTSMLGCVVAGEGVRRRVEEQLDIWDIHPRWVVPGAEAGGVHNGYDHPGRLGADRFVALVGARQRLLSCGTDRPVVVVMVGTACTIDAMDAKGQFLGGYIIPGHGIMLRALEGGTAGLRVPTGQAVQFPTNTSDALTSGGTYAITGAVEKMHRHLHQRTGLEPLLILSGGAGWKVGPYLDIPYEMVDSLIFDGLLYMQSRHLSL